MERRLASAATIWDLRTVARRHVPRAVFDYTDGAAETETSLRRSREAYARIEFVPQRPARRVGGRHLDDDPRPPVGAAAGLRPDRLHPADEPRRASRPSLGSPGRLGIPYALSTLGTTSPEDLAAAAPGTNKWFQLYLWNDRDAGLDLVRRARAAGFTALVLTVDTPVAGARLRDVHNGFTIPPTLSVRTLFDIALHPGWWFDMLTTEPLQFAVFTETGGTVADLINRVFDPTITIADLGLAARRLGRTDRDQGHPDGRRTPAAVVDAGADAIVVSNHGGRQLDRAPTPLEQLPGDRRRGRRPRRGLRRRRDPRPVRDMVAAVASGARAALVGRAYLYGLMAGGERGVQRAGDILQGEFLRTMRLLGARSLDELGPDRVRLRATEP